MDTLPNVLFKDNNEVDPTKHLDIFAKHFDSKLKNIVETVNINQDVYNGKRIVKGENKMFMDPEAIIEVVRAMKKNSEGFDRIPQRVIVEGINNLIIPLSGLFKLIYIQKRYRSNGW